VTIIWQLPDDRLRSPGATHNLQPGISDFSVGLRVKDSANGRFLDRHNSDLVSGSSNKLASVLLLVVLHSLSAALRV
jgi:hypothetical protein